MHNCGVRFGSYRKNVQKLNVALECPDPVPVLQKICCHLGSKMEMLLHTNDIKGIQNPIHEFSFLFGGRSDFLDGVLIVSDSMVPDTFAPNQERLILEFSHKWFEESTPFKSAELVREGNLYFWAIRKRP